MPSHAHKVIVGLSGGVDSSVTALLLLEQGYNVEGLFMKNWEDDDEEGHCSFSRDLADARHVCEKLKIPFHTVNFSDEYWEKVFQLFLTEYSNGRTPNPDILCNKEIKFKAFLDHAMTLGADFIATGHYARIKRIDSKYQLWQGVDKSKDQSYFLYTLTQERLAKSLFPLGDIEKSQVREIAHKAQFLNHNKKDSTGICFIGERKFKSFLSQYLPAKPGDMVNEEGKCIGRHDGLMYYTLGQRKGLLIGGLRDGEESPWYVADKDIKKNQLIVVQGHDNPRLFKSELHCEEIHWIDDITPAFPLKAEAKTRYRQPQQRCLIQKSDREGFIVQFDEPQRAITPGQSIVFYHNEQCLGGSIINSPLQEPENG